MIIDKEIYLDLTIDPVDDFLEHYGVKGMKWGIRKDRDTRNANRQAKREKKAQKFDARADIMQTRIKEVETKLAKARWGKGSLREQRNSLMIEKQKNRQNAEAVRQGKMTSGQKKALTAGVLIAAFATYKLADSGEINRSVMRGKDFIAGKDKHTWKVNPKLTDKSMDINSLKRIVVDPINPNYGQPGTKMNCRRATFAYEMRRRGHDVKATRSIRASGQTVGGFLRATDKSSDAPTLKTPLIARVVKEQFEVSTGRRSASTVLINKAGQSPLGRVKITTGEGPVGVSKGVFSALASQPDGARGELGMQWKMGGGHSMAWEIVKGKPVIFDTQTKKVYSSFEQFAHTGASVKDVAFTRLDNVELNEGFLMRWLKDA